MIFRWEQVSGKRDGSAYLDVQGIGRYLIRRETRGSRTFRAYLNGKSTIYVGTVEQCKRACERALQAKEQS